MFYSVYSVVALIAMHFILKASINGSINKDAGFWISLIPSIMIGTACSMGESTLLGYFRNYPKNLISGWGGGTGISGIAGSGITLLLKKLEIEVYWVYLFMPIFYILYYFIFITIDRLYRSYLKKIEEENNESFTHTPTFLDPKQIDMNDYSKNKPLTWENFKISLKLIWWYVLNIAGVILFKFLLRFTF